MPDADLQTYAAGYPELYHQRLDAGGEDPSFEELRARLATEGRPLSDEDYQHELENYRRENGLDLSATPSYDQLVAQGIEQNQASQTRQEQSSLTYLDVRGAFYRVELLDARHAAKARGVYAIEELADFRSEAAGQLESPILITGVTTVQNDVISLMSCLNNTKVIHTFGQSFGNVQITGEILLGPLGNMTLGERGGVRRILDFFWKFRVSVHGLPITVSVSGEAFYMYLSGLQLGAADNDLHTLPFMLTGTLLDLSREDLLNGASRINPTSQVNREAGLERGLLISEDLVEPLVPTSQAGSAANSTAQDLANRDWSYRSEWSGVTPEGYELEEERAVSRWSGMTDAARQAEVERLTRLKMLTLATPAADFTRAEQAEQNRKDRLQGQSVDPVDAYVRNNEAGFSMIGNSLRGAASDAEGNAVGRLQVPAYTDPSAANQRQAALNYEAYLLQSAGVLSEDQARTADGQVTVFAAARTRDPKLFSSPDAVPRAVFADARPPEAVRLSSMSARAAAYARLKAEDVTYTTNLTGVADTGPTFSMQSTRENPTQIVRQVYAANAAQITADMTILSDAARAGRFPKADYNKLAEEFKKQPVP